jgi:hypothetical protein
VILAVIPKSCELELQRIGRPRPIAPRPGSLAGQRRGSAAPIFDTSCDLEIPQNDIDVEMEVNYGDGFDLDSFGSCLFE